MVLVYEYYMSAQQMFTHCGSPFLHLWTLVTNSLHSECCLQWRSGEKCNTTSSTLKKPHVMDTFDCLGAILYSTLRNIMFPKVRGREFSYSFDIPPIQFFPNFCFQRPGQFRALKRNWRQSVTQSLLAMDISGEKVSLLLLLLPWEKFSAAKRCQARYAYNWCTGIWVL